MTLEFTKLIEGIEMDFHLPKARGNFDHDRLNDIHEQKAMKDLPPLLRTLKRMGCIFMKSSVHGDNAMR